MNNYTNLYVSNTVNHPSYDPFFYLARQILNKLNIQYSDDDFINFPVNKNPFQWPIYPSVIDKLELNFIKKNHEYGYYKNTRMNFRDYMTAYCQHSIGMEFPDFPQDTTVDKSDPSQYMLLPCKQAISFLASINQELVRRQTIHI